MPYRLSTGYTFRLKVLAATTDFGFFNCCCLENILLWDFSPLPVLQLLPLWEVDRHVHTHTHSAGEVGTQHPLVQSPMHAVVGLGGLVKIKAWSQELGPSLPCEWWEPVTPAITCGLPESESEIEPRHFDMGSKCLK